MYRNRKRRYTVTTKALYYVLYLITVPNVLAEREIMTHRIVFEKQENCLYMAHMLKQELDPFARKQQCQENIEYYREMRIPLPKPEIMQ